MPRPSLPNEQTALASIIEAMIFASEEPVPPRTLLRLLYEDPTESKKKKKGPQQTPLFEDVAPGEAVEGATPEGEISEKEASPEDLESEEKPEAQPEDGEAGDNGDEGESEEDLEDLVDAGTGDGGTDRMGQKELRHVIDGLNESYEEEGRSFRIVEIAGGFQFATMKEYGEFVGLLSRDRAKRRLSPAALETLSIIAYRQPVTKPEVEAIRGVNCDQVLVSLMERELITISGRGDTVGRPLLYATTDAFLRAFGLNSLSDLPRLRELEELMEDDTVEASRPRDMPPEFALELLESSGKLTEGEESMEVEMEEEVESEETIEATGNDSPDQEEGRDEENEDEADENDPTVESTVGEHQAEEEERGESGSEVGEVRDREPTDFAVTVDVPDES